MEPEFEDWWEFCTNVLGFTSKGDRTVAESAWRQALLTVTDLSLPPIHRTEANLWKAKYFQARQELVNANRGITRLQRKLGKGAQRKGEK